jgi:hypothetical protein
MSDPIRLGRIILYAREVVLKDKNSKEVAAFAVTRYSITGNKCRVPFNQEPGSESNLYVRPDDPNVAFPPVEGVDPKGECDVEAPFLKYDFKEGQVAWVVVNEKNEPLPRMYGFLSQILRIPIG